MKTSSLLSLFLLVGAPLVSAWQAEVNTGKPGPHLEIRPVSLTFGLSWNGALNSGRANILFGRNDKRYPDSFIVQGYGRSTGVAARLFPYDFNYTSFLDPETYSPRLFIAREVDKKETLDTTNRFGGSSRSKEIATPRKGGAASTRTRIFPYRDKQVFDLFSAVLHIRSLPLANGDEVVMALHPFHSPYLARVKVLGREVHNGRQCIKLDLKLNKIDTPSMTLKTYKKMKTATMWISDDKERLPMEFRVDAFIGDVRAVLDGYRYL